MYMYFFSLFIFIKIKNGEVDDRTVKLFVSINNNDIDDNGVVKN